MDVRDAGVQLHDPSAIVAEGGRYFLYSTTWRTPMHGNGAAIKADELRSPRAQLG